MKSLLGVELDVSKPSQWMPVEGHMFLDTVREWGRENMEWYNIIVCLFPVLIQWALFRQSPRHPRHTLVEGFFIQVFILMLIMMIDTLLIVLGGSRISKWVTLLWPLYYLFALGPIFGYNWWGTLWRSVAVIYIGTRLFIMTCYIIGLVLGYKYSDGFWIRQAKLYTIPVVLLVGGYLISRYTERKRNNSLKKLNS